MNILKWFLSLSAKTDPYEIYLPKERLIYSYFNGEKQLCKDPMVLYKRLRNIRAELAADVTVAQSQHKDAQKADDEALKKIRNIFEVKPFEEGGLTELEVKELFDHFLIYAEQVKKNSNLSPTSSPSTAERKDTSKESPATSSSSASGSTEKEVPTEKPKPCDLPSA